MHLRHTHTKKSVLIIVSGIGLYREEIVLGMISARQGLLVLAHWQCAFQSVNQERVGIKSTKCLD